MSVAYGKYVPITRTEEKNMPFSIEDPIDSSYNPGYTVSMGIEYDTILYEFKRAYLAIVRKYLDVIEIPYGIP